MDFKHIAESVVTLHNLKNHYYGNAFGKSFKKYEAIQPGYGLKYAVGRMGDKMERITNLAFKDMENRENLDESIRDTLVDLAAYAIMTIEAMDNNAESGLS